MKYIAVREHWINVENVTYIIEHVGATPGRMLEFGLVGGETLKIYGLTDLEVSDIREHTLFAIDRR